MTYLMKRSGSRSLAIAPVLAIVLGLGLLSSHARPRPVQAPCHDPASALQSLQASDTGAHYCLTVTSIQVDGSIVTGRNEARNDHSRSNGTERTIAAFMAEVRDSKIVSLFQRTDLADPQMALSAAITAGTAQAGTPIPTPSPFCG